MSFVVDAIRKARTAASDAILDRVSLYCSAPVSTNARSLRKEYGKGAISACENDSDSILPCEPLRVEHGELVDASGRTRLLKGINLDGAMKLPVAPALTSADGDCSMTQNVFFDGDSVSFVGRPFALDDAEAHFRRIKSWGYNTIRYLVTWEALEHAGPGVYDDAFVAYTVEILRVAHRVGGLYVFLECHQDVWSRFCGGSGAPMWTLYAAGLEPTRFDATEAAMLHNSPRFASSPSDSDCYPKMLWTTNYCRLASLTMFTLFFAGETYFPHLQINGVSIQTYLQDRLFGALDHLWRAVVAGVPEMVECGSLFGFESLNEPNPGLVGHPDLNALPDHQQLRLDTTPTVYESFLLGMGLPVNVDTYKISVTGPQREGKKLVDPRGQRAWMSVEERDACDKKYGWTRQGWPDGCIFLAAGIWKWREHEWSKVCNSSQAARMEFVQNHCRLRKPYYFSEVSPRLSFKTVDERLPSVIDRDFFINNFFVDFYMRHKKMVRSVCPGAFVLIQPPVLELPPKLVDDSRSIIDEKTIYCPHYYDGMSLMFKTWNYHYNVDTLGIMRGRYYNPVLGIVFGERAIRNCIKKQFVEIVREGREYLGNIPVLMSETGMPFDMDNKKAYENGRYQLQTSALDAISVALEASNMHHTFWCYTSINSHKWGDRWNNEDFSFWSPEDRDLMFDDEDASPSRSSRRSSVTPSLKSFRSLRETDGYQSVLKAKLSYRRKRLVDNALKLAFGESQDKSELQDAESTASLTDSSTLISLSSDDLRYRHLKKCYPSPDGVRAPSAVIRPYLIATVGHVKFAEFDLKSSKFTLTLNFDGKKRDKLPTVVFVPKWHYPYLNYSDIHLTSGHVLYNERLEYLEWFHQEEDGTIDSSRADESLIIKNSSGRIEDIAPSSSSRRSSVGSVA
ncbi:Cellulase (glycosyl hydrolase 5) family protein [Clavispora lusitaniae]|uniref:Glycosyl hydrolase n=1 Tax=Clavispora lusitaniae (strain ATCC 42720) TaxID=306902 RepID=C4Y9K3_CLAL4|nr:uncharacterized protein CLUG_04893 [Clavispora lusitaniae ATCC 42720]EEQ40765.1 hypothetical protein CLUG_04893 [Clavispora lusitaniae ATCC 42720]KAF7581004.1 Cellulase (glycosyl hydrolase 5) family protein [Clavispora lusitaniae]